MNQFRDAMEKAGITDEFLLDKANELIEAIEKGEFKPRNKERELIKLRSTRDALIYIIDTKKR